MLLSVSSFQYLLNSWPVSWDRVCGLTVFVLFSWVNFKGVSVSPVGPFSTKRVRGRGWDSEQQKREGFYKANENEVQVNPLPWCVCVCYCCSDYWVSSVPQTVPALRASVTSQEIPFVFAPSSLSAFQTEGSIKCTSFEEQGTRIL